VETRRRALNPTYRLVKGPLPDHNEEAGYSFVEGDKIDSLEQEIQAMGGDPFFLEDFATPGEESNMELEEWDGQEDEAAYFD
jgi:hypothetical protein